MCRVARKTCLWGFQPGRHKPGCTVTDKRLDISDLEIRGTVLSMTLIRCAVTAADLLLYFHLCRICKTSFLTRRFIFSGVWGCWSEMSKCSVSCGQGVSARSRQCQSLPPGKPFTIPCDGEAEEINQCNEGPCISKILLTYTYY